MYSLSKQNDDNCFETGFKFVMEGLVCLYLVNFSVTLLTLKTNCQGDRRKKADDGPV